MRAKSAKGNERLPGGCGKSVDYWVWHLMLLEKGTPRNKCGSGQPPKPHCYRGYSELRSLIGDERSSRHRTPKSAARNAHPKLTLQVTVRHFPSSSKEGFLRRPLSPGTGALDMRRISPGDSLSDHRQRRTLSQQIQNISRFDCEHFAAAENLTQPQIPSSLCKNCGAA